MGQKNLFPAKKADSIESVGKEKSPRNLLTTIYPSNVEKNLQNCLKYLRTILRTLNMLYQRLILKSHQNIPTFSLKTGADNIYLNSYHRNDKN